MRSAAGSPESSWGRSLCDAPQVQQADHGHGDDRQGQRGPRDRRGEGADDLVRAVAGDDLERLAGDLEQHQRGGADRLQLHPPLGVEGHELERVGPLHDDERHEQRHRRPAQDEDPAGQQAGQPRRAAAPVDEGGGRQRGDQPDRCEHGRVDLEVDGHGQHHQRGSPPPADQRQEGGQQERALEDVEAVVEDVVDGHAACPEDSQAPGGRPSPGRRRRGHGPGPTGQQAERHEDEEVDGEGQQAVARRVVVQAIGVLRVGAGRQADVDGRHEGQGERGVLDERRAFRRLVAEGLGGRDDVRPMEVVEGRALLAGRAPHGGVVLVGGDVAEGGRHGQEPDAGQDDHRRDHGHHDQSGAGLAGGGSEAHGRRA